MTCFFHRFEAVFVMNFQDYVGEKLNVSSTLCPGASECKLNGFGPVNITLDDGEFVDLAKYLIAISLSCFIDIS